MAQVYSVNAVGYINVDLCAGYSIIANQLDAGAGNNTVGKLLVGVPDGTVVNKFNSATGTYGVNTFEFGDWTNPAETLAPGEAAFIKVPTAAKVTFVGEVPQGTLTIPLVAGFQMVASKVPQTGALDTVLGFPVVDDDVVYQFDCPTQNYKITSYEFGAWSGAAPAPKVGEGFFVKKAAAATWTRTFSVNN
jgi:hypothetical protein